MRQFRNDYSEGAAPAILEALISTNALQVAGYTENDPLCQEARELILDACCLDATEADVEFCVGGTSANILGVTGLLREWEGVIATPDGHINVHETGAIQACGRTILPTTDKDGFVTPEAAQAVWDYQTSCGRHMTRPGCVYISNTTELGGVWSKERFDELCDWADEHELPVYVDGARMASALTSDESEGLTLEHLAKRAAAFTLGGTKNGMLLGEALVMRSSRLREAFPYLVKERGGLLAKGRLFGVQFSAAFKDGLYWELARQANACALELKAGLNELGLKSYTQSRTNQQFFVVNPQLSQRFQKACGCELFWTLPTGEHVIRFVTSWATTSDDVHELLAFARELLA